MSMYGLHYLEFHMSKGTCFKSCSRPDLSFFSTYYLSQQKAMLEDRKPCRCSSHPAQPVVVLGTWTAGEENRFPPTDSRMFSPCSKLFRAGWWTQEEETMPQTAKETTPTSSPDFLITASQCAGRTRPPTTQFYFLLRAVAVVATSNVSVLCSGF